MTPTLTMFYRDDPVYLVKDITWEAVGERDRPGIYLLAGTKGIVTFGEQTDGMPWVEFENGQSLWVDNDWIALGRTPSVDELADGLR